MIISLFIGMVFVTLQVAVAPQIESLSLRIVCLIVSGAAQLIAESVAIHEYDKLLKRIDTLEKSNNKEES